MRPATLLATAAAAIAAVVWSAPCPGCGEGGHGGRLCDACFSRLPRLGGPGCEVCGEPLTPGGSAWERGTGRCALCLDGRDFDRARALGPFRAPLHDLIIAVKYRGRRSLGYDLGRRAALAQADELGPLDVVVPMPLGRRRERERGYNQSLAVAEGAARALGRPLRPALLRRVRETGPQTSLTRAARRDNVRGAFRAAGCAGASVLVVDDVLTTGATADEASRALRRAGASRVAVLTLARATRLGADDLAEPLLDVGDLAP